MDAIAQALADPTVRSWYLGFCLALVLLPLAALWLWYRGRAKSDAVDRGMLMRVSLLTLAWMAVNAVAFGTLMWADGVNNIAG
jgi:hypothetical protein